MAETIGFLILTGLEAAGVIGSAAAIGGTTIFAGLTVAGAVGTVALVGVAAAVAFSSQPQVPSAGDGSQPLRQSIPPRPFGYGRTRVGGAYVLFEADPTDFASIDVVALHQGRIDAIVHYYLNDDIVGLRASDGIVVNLFTGVESADENRYGAFTNNLVTIESRVGLATETPYAGVISALPTLWTSDHRGDGVASLMLRAPNVDSADVPRIYPRGLPKPSIVGDLSPVWDPRDLAQDPEDLDTWTVRSNPVLQLLDYLTHDDRGPALDYDTFIGPVVDAWMAEADLCDAAIAKADGSSEPRYKSDGWAFLSTDPSEVIKAILATCDGWLAEAGDGTLSLKVGVFRDPRSTTGGVVLGDDHILGLELQKGVGDEEIVNEVQFTYTAPQANWRDCPGRSIRDDESIAEIGLVRSERLQLTWVQSHSQGRRLAKRRLARNQAACRGQIVTSLYGLKALGQRWVGVRSRLIADLADAVIEISKVRVDLAGARLVLDWVLVNPNSIDAWDPAEEGDPPVYFPVPVDVSASDSGAGNRINVEFDQLDPAQPWLYYAVDYRVGAGAWTREVYAAANDLVAIGGGRVRLQTVAVPANTYSVRVAAFGRQTLDARRLGLRTNVAVAADANLTLSGEQTIQGIAVTELPQSLVLATAQTNPAENGPWLVSTGAWTRVSTLDTWDQLAGAQLSVTGGTYDNRTFYVDTEPGGGTLGVDPVTVVLLPADLVLDPDLVWAPDVDGTSVVIS